MTKKTPAAIARLSELAPTHTASEIARELGVSPAYIANWAAKYGVRLLSHAHAMKKLNADPEFAARLKAFRKGARDVLIPHWVPQDLHDEFLEVAASAGEIDAARHIRRLKADMRGSASV